MKQKPFELMRLYFGEKDECCGTCCNLREFRYNSKKVRKCIAYGGLHSQKADWAKRWPACGLYGKTVPQQMISDTAKQIFSRIGIRYDDWEFQVDGQISMEAMQNERRSPESEGTGMNAFTLPGTDGIFIQGKLYSKKKLCLDWFQMSNDGFYDLYGFNFNPHEYPGLYDWGRKTLYGE